MTDNTSFIEKSRVERYSDEWMTLSALTYNDLVPSYFWPALLIPVDGFKNDDELPPDAKDFLRGYAGSGKRSAMIVGNVGTGKTWLAYRLLRYLTDFEVATNRVQPGFDVNFIAEDDLMRGRRPNGAIDEVDFDRQFRRTKLLGIDDLGTAKDSEFTEAEMFSLVNYRYSNDLPTIFTSNVATDDLAAKLGDRILDRLEGMCEFIVLTGESRRK